VNTKHFDRGLVWRVLAAGALALAALGLFLIHRTRSSETAISREVESQPLMAQVDRDVDTVLARFGIQKEWIRKSQLPIAGSTLTRIERKITVPPEILAVQVNLALSRMVKKYDGRVVASENSRENTVSIHLEFHGIILETLTLKPDPRLRRGTSAETAPTI